VQNSKNALNNSKLNLSERQKNKSKNYFSLEKYGKSDTASLSFNNNIMKLNTSNKKCMSETAYHKKYKILNKKPVSLNKFNNRNNIYEKNSKFAKYISEYSKINKEILYNLALKTKLNTDINHILNSNANPDKIINKSKTNNYIKEIDNYKSKQFKNKSRDRLLLNATHTKESFMNKIIMKNNGTINNNIYNINSFRANKYLTLKNIMKNNNNNNKSLENIDKNDSSFNKNMNKYKTYKNFVVHNIVFFDDKNKLV
jgi:hypothetical protein